MIVRSFFDAELGKFNNKFTAIIEKINSRDAGYTAETQKILSNCNEFGRISSEFNTSIEALRNDIIQHYTIVQRLFRV